MMAQTVIFWRHGQTDYNVEGRFQGQTDIPLNAVGLSQAAAAAVHLAEYAPEVIVSSDLSRAAVTADALAARLGIEASRDARLRETGFGVWEGHTRAELADRWAAELAVWASGADVAPPGGESRSQSGLRGAAAIRDIVSSTDAQSIAVVAHGAVLRSAAEVLLGMDGSGRAGRIAGLGNCGHGEFTFNGATWVLRSWGTRPSI